MQISENSNKTRQPVQSLQITDNHLQSWSVKRELASTKVGHHMILGASKGGLEDSSLAARALTEYLFGRSDTCCIPDSAVEWDGW